MGYLFLFGSSRPTGL